MSYRVRLRSRSSLDKARNGHHLTTRAEFYIQMMFGDKLYSHNQSKLFSAKVF